VVNFVLYQLQGVNGAALCDGDLRLTLECSILLLFGQTKSISVGDGAREEQRRQKRAASDLSCGGIEELSRRYLWRR
jgi:hypothetical protein